MTRSVVDQTARDRPRVVPEYLPGLRVKGIGIVRCGNVHHAVYNYGRDLENPGVSTVKYPLGLKMRNILRSDLCETAEAPSSVVAVIRRPVISDNPRNQVGQLHIDRSAGARIRALC